MPVDAGQEKDSAQGGHYRRIGTMDMLSVFCSGVKPSKETTDFGEAI
jgi:hypothetical protein